MKKVETVIAAFDVGGTFSKGMLFSADGQPLLENIVVYDSKSQETPAKIVKNFVAMLDGLIKQGGQRVGTRQVQVAGLRLAFPGPFDYNQGISYMVGLNKFDALYGLNLRKMLTQELHMSKLDLSENFSITFLNDAVGFALGEYFDDDKDTSGKNFVAELDSHDGKSDVESITRGGYFTLGTGFGSTFISDGRILRGQGKLPESGMLFDEPFLDGRIDDYLSARGLTQLTRDPFGQEMDLKELARLASVQNEKACATFAEFGKRIGQALRPYLTGLNVQELVFGGQISKSFNYFKEGLAEELPACLQLRASADTSKSTLRGLFYAENITPK